MVANDQRSRSVGSEEEVTLTSHHHDVINRHTIMVPDVECPHCDFRCGSPASMTQHSWEQHPLLMRRKKHLITSSKIDSATSTIVDETVQGSEPSKEVKRTPQVQHTVRQMENCKLSAERLQSISAEQSKGSSPQTSQYRSNAMRSLSLLSTAAAILEQQSQVTPQRHVAVVKPQPVEPSQLPRPLAPYPDHPIYAPMYNAFIPGLNQYVTIPIQMAPGVPNPSILNPSFENAMGGYLHTQAPPRNTQFTQPIPIVPQQSPTKPAPLAKGSPEPMRQQADEIRTLLQTNNSIRKMTPQCQPKTEHPTSKFPQAMEASSPPNQQPLLEKDRIQALEKAILSMDCCDINDTSTKMPFKCSDGVWRMVSFKCIKGLWVVQSPESATPTVYVPCDRDNLPPTNAPQKLGNVGRSLSEGSSGHKRKLSDNLRCDLPVEAKRLCASAPIPSVQSENAPKVGGTPLKRTLSNPFITKSLPPPSQHFTNNEGKRVNISMIKRNNAAQSSSCSLIKSLLLRKPVQTKPTMTSKTQSMTSQIRNNEMHCKSASGGRLNPSLHSQPLSKSSMAY